MLRELIIAVIVAPTLVAAQPAPALPPPGEVATRDNAALGYWRAFEMMTPALVEAIDASASALGEPEFRPPPFFASTVRGQRSVIDQLLRASALPHCDFGIEHSLGPDAYLPHLTPARRAVRLLLIEARLRADDGDAAGAAGRVAAALRLARHLASDRTLVSSRVSWSLFEEVDSVLSIALAPDGLSAAACARIAGALAGFDADDPFRTLASLRQESSNISLWLRSADDDRDARGRVIAFLESLQDTPDPEERAIRDRLLRNLRVGLPIGRLVDGFDAAYAEAIDAWTREDSVGELRAVMDTIDDDEFGPLAGLLVPSLARFRADELAARRRLQAAAARYAAR